MILVRKKTPSLVEGILNSYSTNVNLCNELLYMNSSNPTVHKGGREILPSTQVRYLELIN